MILIACALTMLVWGWARYAPMPGEMQAAQVALALAATIILPILALIVEDWTKNL